MMFKDKLIPILAAALLFAVWQFGYKNYLYQNQSESGLDWKINRSLTHQTAAWFRFTGFETRVYADRTGPHLIDLNGRKSISIDTPCNGLPMMFLYMAFILVYPGSWRRKIGFCLTGLGILHLLNLGRIIGLTYLSFYAPGYFEINHKFIFQVLVYSVTIGIWIFFVLYGFDRKYQLREALRDFFSLRVFQRFSQII